MKLVDNNLEDYSPNCVFFIRGFTSAPFMDSGNTPEDNEVLIIFAIGPIYMLWHSLTNHFGMWSALQKAFEDLSSSCLISLTERG